MKSDWLLISWLSSDSLGNLTTPLFELKKKVQQTNQPSPMCVEMNWIIRFGRDIAVPFMLPIIICDQFLRILRRLVWNFFLFF